MKNDSIFDRMNAHTSSLSALVAGEKTNNQTGKSKATQSKKQLAHRMQFCNVMANAQLMAYNIRGGYQYKPKHLSYHNMFAKYNLGKVKIYLDKNEVLNKACVVAPYNITIGSLPSIDISVQADSLVTSIRVPQGFLITEASTIGEVSAALLSASSDMKRGDQVSKRWLHRDGC